MNTVNKSAGNFAAISSAAAAGSGAVPAPEAVRAQRDGSVSVGDLIDAYMADYAGQDGSRPQRFEPRCFRRSRREDWVDPASRTARSHP